LARGDDGQATRALRGGERPRDRAGGPNQGVRRAEALSDEPGLGFPSAIEDHDVPESQLGVPHVPHEKPGASCADHVCGFQHRGWLLPVMGRDCRSTRRTVGDRRDLFQRQKVSSENRWLRITSFAVTPPACSGRMVTICSSVYFRFALTGPPGRQAGRDPPILPRLRFGGKVRQRRPAGLRAGGDQGARPGRWGPPPITADGSRVASRRRNRAPSGAPLIHG